MINEDFGCRKEDWEQEYNKKVPQVTIDSFVIS